MKIYFHDLSEKEQSLFRTTIAFLDGRMAERDAIEWALRLSDRAYPERVAIRELIDRMEVEKVGEPWQSAWRLIEEFWNANALTQRDEYAVLNRVEKGDRSGAIVGAVVDLVAPKLKIEPFSDVDLSFHKIRKKPKSASDLFSIQITSGDLIPFSFFDSFSSNDTDFLNSLARALDASISDILSLTRRLGWDAERLNWRLGQLNRVQYFCSDEDDGYQADIDAHHRGITPAVKLLHATVARLAQYSIRDAEIWARKWRDGGSSIHLRLWAALALEPGVVSASDAAEGVLAANDEEFWGNFQFPEIALLRARRFQEFPRATQIALSKRIRSLPPRRFWPKKGDQVRFAQERKCAAILEFRRIEVCGSSVDEAAKNFVAAGLPDCEVTSNPTEYEGFPNSGITHFLRPEPDFKYSSLTGLERIQTLESGLRTGRVGWNDDPAERAGDWISAHENALTLTLELDSLKDAGSDFTALWKRLSWALASIGSSATMTRSAKKKTCAIIVSVLTKLSNSLMVEAIDGLTSLMEAWQADISSTSEGLALWLKMWPIAVTATNRAPATETDEPLNTAGFTSADRELPDLDTLNTPVGRLVGFFLRSCPTVKPGDAKYKNNDVIQAMKAAIESTIGTSAAIVKYRLIEQMPYFLVADPDWTILHLIEPLQVNSEVIFWRAVARQKLSFPVMKYLGSEMARRANDKRLARETRRSFVFRVVVDCLDAFRKKRDPAVQNAQVQQMLRSLDDEVRIEGADAVQKYVAESKPPTGDNFGDPFLDAALPFLEFVWPQERSLVTPAISRAFSDLPATASHEFARAVYAIQRYLVPFDCWSMMDFGLYGEENGIRKLKLIDTAAKADAFLTLLDLTLGTAEGAIIPSDLGDALEQINSVAPALASDKRYRRLATAARR